MKIILANVSDAPIIHELMIKSFMEYKNAVPPSSALDETVQSISTALKDYEEALICYVGNETVGMVRFRLKDYSVYFYRLSVIPAKQGHVIAREMLKTLNSYAKINGTTIILCKVRMTVPKNIKFYSSIGFHVYEEEIIRNSNGINIKVVSMEKKLI